MSSPTSLPCSTQGIRLKDILPRAQVVGAEEIYFRSCCGTWHDCQADDLFVAIVEADEDGHDFSHEAVARGAHAVVTERLLTVRRPQCIVPDTREAYGRICQALAGQPSQRLKTIGVSGADGKTITSHLIRSILREAGGAAGLASSIEVSLGQQRVSVPGQRLNSARLAEQLTQMALAGCSEAVIEVSSVDLARRCLSGVNLDVAVLTNIRQSDLEFHGSTRNYRRSQLRLLEQLKGVGVAIINADDPTSHHLLAGLKCPTLTFGMVQEANLTARLIERQKSHQTFVLQAGGESVPISSEMIGDQQIYNCLAAAAAGLALGLDLVTIARGLNRVEPLPGRLERIECGQPFGVWVDTARTPTQLAHAIRSIRQVSEGRLWCVVSADEQQRPQQRRRLGEVAQAAADDVVLTRTSGGDVIDYEPLHQVLDGCRKPESVRVVPNRFRALEWTLEQAQPGDAVLISGCGERPFALIGDEDWTIGDRDVCEAWLYDHASLLPMPTPQESMKESIFKIDDYR